MSAHLRPVPMYKCERRGCPKRATQQLYSTRNAPMGRYCAPHAHLALIAFLHSHPEEGDYHGVDKST